MPFSGSPTKPCRTANGDIAEISEEILQIPAINVQAATDYDKVFNITHRGTQSVGVWITDDGSHPGSRHILQSRLQWFGVCHNGLESIEGHNNAVQVDVGQTIVVSLLADTTGLNGWANMIQTMTIHAEAGVDGATSPGDCPGFSSGDANDDDDDDNDTDQDALKVTPDENAEPITNGNGKQTFTVHNNGDEPLTVCISLSGSEPSEFQISSGSTSTTIPAGGNHQIKVEAVDASDGSTAVVSFSSDQRTVERSAEN